MFLQERDVFCLSHTNQDIGSHFGLSRPRYIHLVPNLQTLPYLTPCTPGRYDIRWSDCLLQSYKNITAPESCQLTQE